MTYKEAFGIVLKEMRTERKLSQNKLAKMSGLSRTFIARLENSEQSPTIETVFMLSQALNIKAEKLIETVRELSE